MKKILWLVLVLSMLLVPSVVLAELDFDQDLTPEEEEQFDDILAPVMKVYNFIKYAASILGVLMLVFAGISFITAGGETGKKERAKNMAVGVVVGLIVIWVAPLVVKYVFA